MNVVSIMAHQDDEMRCLGTMLKCRARGDHLHFVTLTDGSKGFVHTPSISREEAARIRHTEMQTLARDLAASYINVQEPDEFLYDTPDGRMKLIEAIRKTKADLIFTHYTEDYNLDHVTVNAMVRQSAMQSCLPVLPTASPPLATHPAIFMVEPHGTIPFPASHYVDITLHHADKVRLLSHHVSQNDAMRRAVGSGLAELSTTLAAFRGEQVGCLFAEAFVPMSGRGALKPFSVLP